jgi:Zn-dependent peptidase ImmA (M78 family)
VKGERVFPRLPRVVEAPGGTVTVTPRRRPKADGDEVWGSWDEGRRRIEIDSEAPLRHQWKTFYHELAHAALSDCGVDEILDEKAAEAVCDAIAIARMRERFG